MRKRNGFFGGMLHVRGYVPHVETAGAPCGNCRLHRKRRRSNYQKKKEKDVGKRSLVQMVARARELARRLTFSFFGEIPVVAGNEISTEILPNFVISERGGNLNSKNEIPMYTSKISVILAEIWCPEGEIRCL